MRIRNRALLVSCLTVLTLFLVNCRQGSAPEKTDYSSKKLQDLNSVFENYERLEKRGKYTLLARKILEANRDLESSELYVEAASLYLLSGVKDSSVILLHKALDHGMANPSILKKFPGLEGYTSPAFDRLSQRLDSLGRVLHDISNFAMETRAMDQFWPYFEKAIATPDSARYFLKAYILGGPPEIRDYYAIRYYNLDNMYGQMINGAPKYYGYLRSQLNTDSLTALKGKTTAALETFKTLYPEAVFPKVYIVPGLLNSGGTASEMGMFLGGDMYGKSGKMPVDELSDWQKDAIMDFNSLPKLILHELMHFQQNYSDQSHENTVLYKVIEEGVCDFLAELTLGKPMESVQLEYLSNPEHFKNISGELKNELFTEDLSLWMYNGGSIEDRPPDLGYALGYLITKSYYQNATDKKLALYNLLNTENMRSILEGSSYGYLLSEDSSS